MKYWKIIFYCLGIFPWTFIVSLMMFYYHAEKILGRPPSYNKPDPKELSIYKDYSPIIDWTAEIWLYSFVIWFILAITYIIIKRKEIQWGPIVVSGIGQFFGILLFLSGITEWYLD